MIMQIVALVLTLGLAAPVGAAETGETKAVALAPAMATAVEEFNKAEQKLRDAPQVERVGPADDPYLLRATYRRAGGPHEILKSEGGDGSVVTVRIRAMELEKRATKVNAGELEREFAKAPWRETPRGYVLDFRFHWNGSKWEQMGEPVAHPTLGIAGRP